MGALILGLVLLAVAVVVLPAFTTLNIAPKRLSKVEHRDGVLRLSGGVYFEYLDRMTRKNTYGRDEITQPTILNDGATPSLKIRLYTNQTLADFTRQFFNANLYKKKFSCSTHEVNLSYGLDKRARHVTIQIITASVKILRRKALILTIAGREFIVAPSELLRMCIFETMCKNAGLGLRAFDIEEQRLVFIRFFEGDHCIDIDFNDILDVGSIIS